MPFDGELKPTPVRPASDNERWSYRPDRVPMPRYGFNPLSDIEALYHVLNGIRNNWARQFNGPEGTHCIVGWIANTCEPMTVVDFGQPQTKRLLQRLHNAMPKSAQRKDANTRFALAKYNDTHSREAVYRVAERAYISLVNDLQGST